MGYIRLPSEKKKLMIMIKGYTLVSLNWIGKIDGMTITSALTTKNIPIVPYYLNIHSRNM